MKSSHDVSTSLQHFLDLLFQITGIKKTQNIHTIASRRGSHWISKIDRATVREGKSAIAVFINLHSSFQSSLSTNTYFRISHVQTPHLKASILPALDFRSSLFPKLSFSKLAIWNPWLYTLQFSKPCTISRSTNSHLWNSYFEIPFPKLSCSQPCMFAATISRFKPSFQGPLIPTMSWSKLACSTPSCSKLGFCKPSFSNIPFSKTLVFKTHGFEAPISNTSIWQAMNFETCRGGQVPGGSREPEGPGRRFAAMGHLQLRGDTSKSAIGRVSLKLVCNNPKRRPRFRTGFPWFSSSVWPCFLI